MMKHEQLNWAPPKHLKWYEKYLNKCIFTKKNKLRKGLKKLAEKAGAKPNPASFIKSQLSKFKNAHRLNAYMKFRSFGEFPDLSEKERYQLAPKFFMDNFKHGVFKFFGIRCCECCGKIIEDAENPSAYKRFCMYETDIKSKQPTVH